MTDGLQAVIFDWAGTLVDHGCFAGTRAFVALFAEYGVLLTEAEARGPMGTHKRAHIRQLLQLPRVAEAWRAAHGAAWTDADVDRLYDAFTAVQVDLLPAHAAPIPGAVEALDALRARGVRVGSTTGYNREMLDVVRAAAAEHGLEVAVAIPSSEVPEGRPAPFLLWTALTQLGVWPAHRAVKVGDNPVDIAAGRHAGCWTVGYARTGNLVGLSAEDASKPAAAARIERARATLSEAGAHAVVDGPWALHEALEDIEARMRAGERP